MLCTHSRERANSQCTTRGAVGIEVRNNQNMFIRLDRFGQQANGSIDALEQIWMMEPFE